MDAAGTPSSSAMADISEVSRSSASEIQKTEPEFDPETMRKTKPGLKRLVLTLTVLLSFLLGLPFLLKSVEIYRSPLPFREIDDLSAAVEVNPLHFPFKFRAVFVDTIGASITANELSVLTESHMRTLAAKDSTSCGACSFNSPVSVTLESGSNCFHSDSNFDWKCGSLTELNKYGDSGIYDDELFDDYLKSLLDDTVSLSNGGKVYTAIVVRREKEENMRVVVGKYRHAWVVGRVSEEEAVKKVAEIFVKAFVNGGKEEGSITGEFMPVGADGKIVLSFNLLNADPRDWSYNWDFQEIDDNLLAPITEALKPLADIRVESQVLYHTPKSSFSYWDEKLGGYVFTTNDLPFFVNSNEWHLDTSVAAGGRSKILHFVLPNGEISTTNGFISPMWGGVVVWNPSACFKDSNMETRVKHKISPEDLRKIFEVFISQLRQLFGLKSKGLFADAPGSLRLLTSDRGFTEWELDVLSRQHTCFNLLQCATTLGSLSRLVQSLPRMIIKDEIGKQVKYSLEAAKLALSNVSDGVYDASAVSSRQARSFAEDAFYHPSMMSVSYYSFEHCFAVYSLSGNGKDSSRKAKNTMLGKLKNRDIHLPSKTSAMNESS
ncbi:GPI transamidase component pig-s [Phtheirospermum japonicum]|uniref:GPI transamidase component pig-s n=1 Tax=Phtheirospermum japonicum TaxID=374723 RepID=A0A830D2Q6_9LAMI|nr:GPI transamidase component pig-s [Phtheirospermum japonicum]